MILQFCITNTLKDAGFIYNNSEKTKEKVKKTKPTKLLFVITDGSCSLPSPWTGDWYDSFYGQLTFSATTLTGWQVQAYATTITSWTCVSEDTTNNYLLFL